MLRRHIGFASSEPTPAQALELLQSVRLAGCYMAERAQMSESEVDQASGSDQVSLKKALTCLGKAKECREKVKMDYECLTDLAERIKGNLDAADQWIDETEATCNQL